MFFNLEVDTSGFVPEEMTPFSVTEFEEPLAAFTHHMEKLESSAPSPEEKEILSEAKELSEKYLMKASTGPPFKGAKEDTRENKEAGDIRE